MQASNLTGLELMQMVVSGEIPRPSIMETVPMVVKSAEKGRVVFTATANDKLLNPMGGVHGGFAATVLDSVTGCAVHTVLDKNVMYGTIELSIKMMRPVPLDVELIAHGEVINLSKSLAVSQGKLLTPEGKLIAHATCTCFIKS